MRKAVAIAAGLGVLAFVNFGIWEREQLLADGRTVLLRLAPVDPRSLMQGDYMALDFEVARQLAPLAARGEPVDGRIVVALDTHGVAHFRRFADGKPLGADEVALHYRIRGGRPRFATDAFFFEEGQAEVYAGAEYGEFRVGDDGDMILTGLRGSRLEPLKP